MQNVNESASLIRFQVRSKRTFDSSKTPTVDDPEPFVPELGNVSRDVLLDVAKLFGEKTDEEFGSDESEG